MKRTDLHAWAYALAVRAGASEQSWWGGKVFSMTADDLPPLSMYAVTSRRVSGQMTSIMPGGHTLTWGVGDKYPRMWTPEGDEVLRNGKIRRAR